METQTIRDRRIAAMGGIAFAILWPGMIFMSGLDYVDEPRDYVAQLSDDAEAIKFSTWFGMLASVGLALFGAGLALRLRASGERYLGAVAAVGKATA